MPDMFTSTRLVGAAGTWSNAIGMPLIMAMALCLGVINSFDGVVLLVCAV